MKIKIIIEYYKRYKKIVKYIIIYRELKKD